MRSTHATLVLCGLLALTTAATPAVAVAPESPDATRASSDTLASNSTPPTIDCSGVEETTVVAMYETGRTLSDGTTLYPGTTLTLSLCVDGERAEFPTEWGLGESPAYRIVDNGTYWVQVVVVESNTETVSLPAQVQRREPTGPSFRVTTSSVVQWHDKDNETAATLQFESAADRKAFDDAAANYSDAVQQFNRSIGAVGTDTESLDLSDDASPNLTTALGTFERAAGAVQRTSLEASAVGGQGAAATVVEASESDVSSARKKARKRLAAHLTAVESVRDEATRFSRVLFGGTVLGGLVVGLAGGVLWSRRTVREVEYDKNFDSNSRLSLSDFTLPLVLGGLALLAGVAIGGLLGGGAILGVIF